MLLPLGTVLLNLCLKMSTFCHNALLFMTEAAQITPVLVIPLAHFERLGLGQRLALGIRV